MPSYRDAFRNRNFMLYNIGQMLSQLGDRLTQIALIGIVYSVAPGSTTQLAKLLFFTVLPAFVISPIAGVYVDRWKKRFVLISADITRSALVLMIAVVFLKMPDLVPVYVSVFLIFVCACFFLPAKLAIIPSLIEKDYLLLANSIATVMWMIAGAVGFAAGGFIIEYMGVEKGLYLNSAIYVASATVLALISPNNNGKMTDANTDSEFARGTRAERHFFVELAEGLKYMVRSKEARLVMLVYFTLMAIAGALYVVTAVFIQEYTRAMTSTIGLFSFFFGAGGLAGTYFMGRADPNIKKTKLIFGCFFIGGALIALFAAALRFTGSLWLGGVLVFLVGLVAAPVMVCGNTLVHESISEEVRARVFSSLGIIMNAGFVIFMFLSSHIAEYTGSYLVITVCGAGLSLLGISGYFLADRDKKKRRVISSS